MMMLYLSLALLAGHIYSTYRRLVPMDTMLTGGVAAEYPATPYHFIYLRRSVL